MPLQLPDAESAALSRPPLGVVVCQVRYEQTLRASDVDAGLTIHEDLGGREGSYSVVEPQQQLATQIELGPAGLASLSNAGVPRRGWRIRSSDQTWGITLMPDFVSLETTAYRIWDGDFRDRINAVLLSVEKNLHPRGIERIGLRYVNNITEPDRPEPADWAEVIRPELLGPVANSFWSSGIKAFQQQIELDLEGDSRCIFRQGLVPGPTGEIEGYLLDYDIFSQYPQRFDVENVMGMLDSFNRAALALFQNSITPDYLTILREE